MATEADVPEAISVARGDGEDRYLKDQCSQSKGKLDQHPEKQNEKPFAQSEDVQVGSMQVESKNNISEISEGEQFLNSLSEPKVEKQETFVLETPQTDEMEMPDNETLLDKGKQLGAVEETCSEENVVLEETNKNAEQIVDNHETVNSTRSISEMEKTEYTNLEVERVEAFKEKTTLDQHVQAISDQQESIKETPKCLEQDLEGSQEGVQGTEKTDGNADPEYKEASGVLEASTFEEETLEGYEPDEELQKLPKVQPEDTRMKPASESDEVITCIDEETRIQHTEEYLEKEEATPMNSAEENDSITEEVFKATSKEKESGEHALPEIHTAETSSEYQEVAGVSTNIEKENLQKMAIQEKSSFLADEIPSEEESSVSNSIDEKKEADAKCEEPIEVAIMTRETKPALTEMTQTNKDLYVPILEEEAYAKESNKALVQNTSSVTEVPEIKIKETFQEENPRVGDYDSESGVVSHVPGPNEAEAEDDERVENNPKEKGLQTALKDEAAMEIEDPTEVAETFYSKENTERQIQTAEVQGERDLKETEEENKEPGTVPKEKGLPTTENIELQVEENVNMYVNLDKQSPKAADEGDNGLMESQAENYEQVTNSDISLEQKGIATILTDETALGIDDTEFQTEENFNSKEKLKYLIPEAADESGTSLKESEEEIKEQIKSIDNSSEESGLTTTLTGETALSSEDIDEHGEKNSNPQENSEKQIPEAAAAADEREVHADLKEPEEENKHKVNHIDISPEEKGLETVSIHETRLDAEDSDAKEVEYFNSNENFDKQIPAAADEGDKSLEECEEENKQQFNHTDISPEEKGHETISIHETAHNTEDNDAKEVEYFNSNENFEKQIPAAAADEGDTSLSECEMENKEQIKSRDISPEEKGLLTILTDETALLSEDTDAHAEKESSPKDNLENQLPKTADEADTGLKEPEEENKEQVKSIDICPEEKGLETILTDETTQENDYIEGQSGELNSKEILDKQIPPALDEGEADLQEAEAENKEQLDTTVIAPEQKGLSTILRDETALNIEEIDAQPQDNLNSNENLEEHIPTAVDRGEIDLNESEAENKEQVKYTDIATEEKGLTTISRDEMAPDIAYVEVPAEEKHISKGIDEGEEKVGHGDIAFAHIPINVCETELVGEETVEESFHVQSQEEAEPKLEFEDDKSEDYLERNHIIVKEVLDEPKVTGGDLSQDQIIEGNVATLMPESIEEDTVKHPENNEQDMENLEEKSCTRGIEEGNASDLSPEYVPKDGSENFKDEEKDAVKSKEEILEDTLSTGVDEITTYETRNVEESKEIDDALPVKHDEGQHGEGSNLAPTNASKEKTIEEMLPVKLARDNDGDSGAVTSHEVRDETVEENFHEEAEPKLEFEDDKSEDYPERNDIVVKEVLDEPKVTGGDLNQDQIIEGNVAAFMPESVEEDTVKHSENNEQDMENLEEEKSCTRGIEEGNADNLSPEYVPKDGSENFKDDQKDAVKSKEEILEDTLTTGVDEITTYETKNVEGSEQIDGALPVKHDEGQHGEGSNLAPTNASNEETIEEPLPVELARENDADRGAVTSHEVRDETVEESFHVQHQEEAEPKLEFEDEKSEDYPDRNHKIVKEVLDEPKVTGGDLSQDQIIEGNVATLMPESIEEDAVKHPENNEQDMENLEEEKSCTRGIEEGNASDLSPEYVPKDGSENFKDEEKDAVKSKEEILEDTLSTGVDEITTYETRNVEESKEIDDALPVKHDEGQHGEGSNLAPTNASKEKTIEEMLPVKLARDNDGDSGAVTSHEVRDETVEENFHEEAEPKLEFEDDKSEDYPERNDIVVKEVLDEPKVTGGDLNQDQIIEGNVAAFMPESGEEDTVKHSENNEQDTENLEEEKSCTRGIEEGNADNLSPEYVPKDGSENFKDDQKDAVKSKEEILEDTLTTGVDEITTYETKNVEGSEQIDGALPVKHDEGQHREGSNLAPTNASNEETIEEPLPVELARENDADRGAVTSHEVRDETVEESFHVQRQEEAEPKLEFEDEKSEDYPDRNHIIVKEVLDEPKVTGGDLSQDQIIEGNVATLMPESIEEDAVKHPENNEQDMENLEEEKSCTRGIEEGNASDLSPEYVPKDGSENFKDEEKDAVKSKEEILEDTLSTGVDEITTYETRNVEESKEIDDALPVKHDEGQHGEGSNLAPTNASKEKTIEEMLPVKLARDNDGDSGAVTSHEVRDETVEEAEPKLEFEDEKSEDYPDRNLIIVKEVLDEPKITGGDLNEEQIIKGNVATFMPESTEGDTVKYSENIEQDTVKFKEEESCIESVEGNADDLSPECVPKDGDKNFKDEEKDTVKPKEEIFEDTLTTGEDEITKCETKNVEASKEIVDALPVKYDEGQMGEGSKLAPTTATKEETTEEPLPVKMTRDNDGDSGPVTVTEMGAEVTSNDEEDTQQSLPKYEPGEELKKLPDVMPREMKPESLSEYGEVIACTEEERTTQETQESPDKEKNAKESDTASEEVLDTTEQETKHASQDIHTIADHPQEFIDKETTEANSTEYQACTEAAELSTTKDSSKEEESFLTNLTEEANEGHEECKQPIEGTDMTCESRSEIIEGTEPDKDLNTPISEEESNKKVIQDNSSLSEVSQKDIEKENPEEFASTVNNFDSVFGVVSEEIGLKEATAKNKEQVEATYIAPEEKEHEGYLHAEDSTNSHILENKISTVRDESAEKSGKRNVDDNTFEVYTESVAEKTVEQSFPVQSLEEAEPKLEVDENEKSEDHPEKNNTIFEEALDKPKITERDFNKEHITDGNFASFTTETIEDVTVENYQDEEKEPKNLIEEGSSLESIKKGNANNISPEYVLEDKRGIDEAIDCNREVRESTTCDKNENAETAKEILNISQVIDGQQGEEFYRSGPTKTSKEDDCREDTIPFKVSVDNDENNGEVAVSEAGATSIGEESTEAMQMSELGEEHAQTKATDLPYENEVRHLDDNLSFAEKTEGETGLQNEGPREVKVSKLDLEKLDSNVPEEQVTKDSKLVTESDSKRFDAITQDEVNADQTRDEGISKEHFLTPHYTLLSEVKEIKASEPEHETTTPDKNIEEEHSKAVVVPSDEHTGELVSARAAEEACLQMEDPSVLKVSELVMENRDAAETEEVEETFETIYKSESQTIDAVSRAGIIEEKTDIPLEVASYTSLPREKELEASELVGEKLNADTPEEEIKEGSEMVPQYDSQSNDGVSRHEIIADQNLHEGISTEKHQIPSSALLPEENEIRASEHKHDISTLDKVREEQIPKEVKVPFEEEKQEFLALRTAKETCLQKEESKELKDSVLGLQLDTDETKEEIQETFETVSNSDSQSISVAPRDEIIADQTPCEEITDTTLPKEKESVTSELDLEKLDAEDTKEEIQESFETVSKSDSQSITVVSGDEIIGDDQKLCEEISDTPLPKDEKSGDSELDLEKRDAEDTKGQMKESSQIVPKYDPASTDIVSNDEITADQTFIKGEIKEKLQIPSSPSPPEKNEFKAFELQHETTAQDKNIEPESTEELKVPAEGYPQALFAAKSKEETFLQTEEPIELKVSEMALEKLDAGEIKEATETSEIVFKSEFPSKEEITADESLSMRETDIPLETPSYTSLHEEKELKASELDLENLDIDTPEEEEIKEGSELIHPSDSQITGEVSKDDIFADSKEQLQVPTSTLVPDQNELKISEHEHETTIDDRTVEYDNSKQTCLQKEEPGELRVYELALEKVDAGETEEVKETFETVPESDSQTLCDVTTDMPLDIPPYASVPEEKELNASDLALEKLESDVTPVVKEGSEMTPKSDPQSLHVVSQDDKIVDQILHHGITEQQLPVPSSTLLPAEKELIESEHEHGTATQDKNLEEEYVREMGVTDDEKTRDFIPASSEEKTHLQKEEPGNFKVPELAPEKLDVSETEEETETSKTIAKSVSESADAVSKDEIIAEQTFQQTDEQLQISSPTLLPKEKGETEENKDEKAVAKESKLIVVAEENIRDSQQDDEPRTEKYPEEKNETFNNTTTDDHFEVPEVDVNGTVSREFEKQVMSDDKSFEDHIPEKAEERNVQETAIVLDLENQGVETNYSTEGVTNPIEKDRREEISDKGTLAFEEANVITQDIKQLEKTSHATCKAEAPVESLLSESTVTNISSPSRKEDAPRFLHDPIVETTPWVQSEDTRPSNDTLVATETKEEECGTEKKIESGVETSTHTSPSDNLMHEPTKDRIPVATHLTEEKEPTASKEMHTGEEEEEEHGDAEEVNTDEEKEDTEHKNADHGYDEPVMVEASKDTEVKASPKKSHNLLSGMGSKVKHSISKVRKAITGKSSHSKTQSEK